MKKKGFTLVELLAVIAILAILVIIALPNVIGLFNDARKNSFANEVRELYKQSETQWSLDSSDIFATGGGTFYYSNQTSTDNTITCTELKMSGRQNINYYITRDSNGVVTKIQVEDGTYQFEANGDVKITDITNASIQLRSELENDAKITITCPAS